MTQPLPPLGFRPDCGENASPRRVPSILHRGHGDHLRIAQRGQHLGVVAYGDGPRRQGRFHQQTGDINQQQYEELMNSMSTENVMYNR
jgi:hypothetical protein